MINNVTVLIVDDDDRNIFALSAVLRAKGYHVESAQDGKMGIKKLKANTNINVVLMDMMMAVMDGYEAIRLIRLDEKLTHIPIISLTANAMLGDKEKCIEAGANDYCAKPVIIEGLIEKINNCLKK